jgi:hypothetical protein
VSDNSPETKDDEDDTEESSGPDAEPIEDFDEASDRQRRRSRNRRERRRRRIQQNHDQRMRNAGASGHPGYELLRQLSSLAADHPVVGAALVMLVIACIFLFL